MPGISQRAHLAVLSSTRAFATLKGLPNAGAGGYIACILTSLESPLSMPFAPTADIAT